MTKNNELQLQSESPEVRMALFDFAFDHAPIGIALVDIRGRIIRGNAAFAELVGRPLVEVTGMAFADFTHPDDLEADLALFQDVLAGTRDGYSIEKRYIRPDGAVVHVLIHIAAMRDEAGEVIRLISQIQNITDHKEYERRLAERAAQLELAMEAVRGGFWYMDVGSRQFETSDRLAQFIAGPAAARMDLENYLKRVNVDDGATADLTPLLAGEVDQAVAEYRLETIVGERWMRCDRRLLRDAEGKPLRIVGMAIDFTDEHNRFTDLEHTSRRDALTGLLNRRGLSASFSKLIAPKGYSVLAVDLDGFKPVNDIHGHAAGDSVLVETARRLLSCVRGADLVCRTGGDEFLLVVAGTEDTGKAVAERVVAKMRAPVGIVQGSVDVRASVGGVWAKATTDLDQLLGAADKLLYEAKAKGKDRCCFQTMRERTARA
ncbi:GGDEF domain-containing protein [Shinella zoogloeoides]|uniref:GGDEF domain-containing protein n=1 Tax=Shinella zoogloeoides TaxID=352475 RepID=UPI00273E8DCA|nr:sensor domain-containing diguanylate cyclase [Shinella zoogloeoides]WLR91307.1 diguanylate cyclase [Shinella zoogloeoides]